MSLKWLENNIIYITLHGSKAYGLNTEFSDVDIKGICIPPKDVEYNLFNKFEQAENNELIEEGFSYLKNVNNPKLESTIYSLRKFITLASNINPNICELLWSDENDRYLVHPIARKLLENRNLFLSSRAKFTFSGYAWAQLHKIERHRKWIVKGEISKPKREDFGLSEEKSKGIDELFGYIKSEVERWNLSQYPIDESQRDGLKSDIWDLIYHISKLNVNDGNWPKIYEQGIINKISKDYNLKDELIDLLKKECIYKKEMETYKSWLNWKNNRNPERHKLEVKCGYDSKHASQLVRLLKMGIEILNEHKVIVKRPDREELLFIKNGGWSYDKLMEYVSEMQIKLDESYINTTLPKSVDYNKINKFYHQLYDEYHYTDKNIKSQK